MPSRYSRLTQEEIVKVTSKGQITIPAVLRNKTGLKKGSYIYIRSVGDVVLMKKVDELGLDDISKIFSKLGREKGLTRSLLNDEIERARSRLWKETYGKKSSAKSSPRH